MARTTRCGQRAAELAAPLEHVLDLGGVLARVEERRGAGRLVGLLDVAVAHRQVEPVAELLEVVELELLHLVGGVLALQRLDRPALDGVGQDHRRLADVLRWRRRRRRRPCGSRGRRAAASRSAGRSCARPSCAAAGRARRSARGCRRRPRPSRSGTRRRGCLFIWLTRTPSTSRASSSSHSRPQITLMTFQPAPRKLASSSWMILPLPVTGPSSCCRLQLMTKVRLSSSSRAAMPDRAERLGLGHLAVAEERPDVLLAGVLDAAVVQVAVEPGLVDRVDAGEPHRDGRELPEVRHQPRVRVGRAGPCRRRAAPPGGSAAAAARSSRPSRKARA